MIKDDKQRITITIDSEMYVELEVLCEEADVTKSEIINALLYSCFWYNDTLMKEIVKRKNDKSKK